MKYITDFYWQLDGAVRKLYNSHRAKDALIAAVVILTVLSTCQFVYAAPFDNAYVGAGFAYEDGDTFGDGKEWVGVARIGTELWEGWRLEYEHHSNLAKENDKNSYDALGIVVEFRFGNGCK